MNPRYKRIYCCTPIAFRADENTFFIRDTGLISRSIRNMGVESKVIMPLPYSDGDLRDEIIRTEYKNLESVEWWKSLGIDGLVLYSWGAPRYRKIARAVHKAGIRLHIHMDTSGLFEGNDWDDLTCIKKIFRLLSTKVRDFFRANHLKNADIISSSLPAANIMCERLFFRGWMRKKINIFPTPVASHFRYLSSSCKERLVVCVGRWSDDDADRVKRPEFMLNTAREIALADERVQVEIYGTIGAGIQKKYDRFPAELKARIHLKGFIRNGDLPNVYNKAQVSYCSSNSEGTHIASAEAVCCGCSLVIPPRKSLHVLHWYTSHGSGQVAAEDTPESMAQSVVRELDLWESQQRNPREISDYWQNVFIVDKALHRIFEN